MAMSLERTSIQLDYARPALQRRAWRRRIVAATCVILITTAGWAAFGQVKTQVQCLILLRYQGQCLAFLQAPNQVVYEEHADVAARLVATASASGGRWYPLPPNDRPTSLVAAWRPSCLERYLNWLGGGGFWPDDTAVVFCHERRCPAGRRRLVVIRVRPYDRASVMNPIQADTYEIDSTSGRLLDPNFGAGSAAVGFASGELCIRWVDNGYQAGFNPAVPMRVFAGVPDANDPTRFSFSWEAGGIRYLTEGQLVETDAPRSCGNAPADTVHFTIRRATTAADAAD